MLKAKLVERSAPSYGLKLGKAQAPVRVAVTGRTVGLPLFESLEVLGRQRTLLRLRAARERLAKPHLTGAGPGARLAPESAAPSLLRWPCLPESAVAAVAAALALRPKTHGWPPRRTGHRSSWWPGCC